MEIPVGSVPRDTIQDGSAKAFLSIRCGVKPLVRMDAWDNILQLGSHTCAVAQTPMRLLRVLGNIAG